MPETDPLTAFTSSPLSGREAPIDKIRRIARSDNLPDDIADDFSKVTGLESGRSHYGRGGRVKVSPVDPKDGQRAIGFSQIKPSTARSVGVDNPYDEESNIKAGLRYYAQGGNDPVRRRIAYFSGQNSGAVKHYDRTGRIPSGGDFTGTSFKQYIAGTGGSQQDPLTTFTQGKQSTPPTDPLSTFTQSDSGTDVQKSAFSDVRAGMQGSGPPLTTNDAAWHLGMTPEEAKRLTPKALSVLSEGVMEDQRKKAAGQTIQQPSLKYQNEMRKAAGLKPLKFNVATDESQVAPYYQPDAAPFSINEKPQIQVKPRPFAFKGQSDEDIKAAIRSEVISASRAENTHLHPEARTELNRADVESVVNDRFNQYKADQARTTETARLGPSMQARTPGIGERIGESLGSIATSLNIDTPMGLKSDVVRGAARGLLLPVPSRTITPEEKLIDPNAEAWQKSFLGPESIGELSTAFLPYIGAAKLVSKLGVVNPMLRDALTFGTIDAVRQVSRTGKIDPQDVAESFLTGGAIGRIAGLDPSLKRRIVAYLTPQVIAGVAKGQSAEQIAQSSITNLGYALAGAREAREEAPTQTVSNALQAKLRGGEIDTALAAREAAVKPSLQPENVPAMRVADQAQNARPIELGQSKYPETKYPESLGVVGPTKPVEGIEEGAKLNRWQHRDFGLVTESVNQSNVGKGRVRVLAEDGTEHVIQRPKGTGAGNQIAVPIRGSRPIDARAADEAAQAAEREPFKVIDRRHQPTEQPSTQSPAEATATAEPPRSTAEEIAQALEGRGLSPEVEAQYRQAAEKEARDRVAAEQGTVPRPEVKTEPPAPVDRRGPDRLTDEEYQAKLREAGIGQGTPRDQLGTIGKPAVPEAPKLFFSDGTEVERTGEMRVPDEGEYYLLGNRVMKGSREADPSDPVREILIPKTTERGEGIAPTETTAVTPEAKPTTPAGAEQSAPSLAEPIEGERAFPKTLESTRREGGTDRTYQVVHDQEAIDKADARIKEDPEAARQWASEQLDKGSGKEAIATGLRVADSLSTEAAKESDSAKAAEKHAQASELYSKLAARLTESGQEVQAASLAQKYSPSGAALEVQRIVEQVKGKGTTPEIQDTQTARDLAEKYQTADARISELEQQIAQLQSGKSVRPRTSSTTPLKAKLDKAAEDAALRIAATKAQMKAGLEFRNAGPLPGHIATHLADYAIIGAAKIAKGGLTFADWSAEMVKDLGEDIKPHLATIFRASKKHLDAQRAIAREESAQRGATKELSRRGVAPTPENIESLRQEKSKLQAERRQARIDLDRHYRELERKEQGRKLDAVLSLTRDSLLAARGVMRIAIGMGGKQIVDFGSRFVKAGTDVARSAVTGGPRTVSAPSFASTLRTIGGFVERAPSSIKSAVQSKPSEVMPNVHGPVTENPYVNLTVGIMQRIYAGKEAFLSSWAYPEALENNARVFALNDRADGITKLGQTNQRTRDYLAGKLSFEGKRNQKLAASLAKQAADYEVNSKQIVPSMKDIRVKELAESPSELLHSMARQATDRAVYRQPFESKLAQKLNEVGRSSTGGKILRNVVLPFSHRPANNIADNLFGYTGVRIFGEGYKGIRESINGEFGPARVKSFNDAIGKGATGFAVMSVGALLAKQGKLISPLDKDKSKAGSLFINGKYYNVSNVPVVGWLLGMGAAYQKDGAANLPKALYRMISEHPLLRSAKDIGDTVEGLKSNKPAEQISEYAGKQASRLIPAPVKIAAEALDTEERQTKFAGRKASVKENLTAPAEASLPILRRRLPSTGTKGRLSVINPLYSKPISRRPQGRLIQ